MIGRTYRSGSISISFLELFSCFRSSNIFKKVPGANCPAKNVNASPDEVYHICT